MEADSLLVMLVDHDKDLRSMLDINLTNAGYRTLQAESGKEALARADAYRPDIVILDLNLPDISGSEVCRRLKSNAEFSDTTSVMMLTARDSEADRIAGFEVGAEDYVTKPFSLRELVLRLNVIKRRRLSTIHTVAAVLTLGPLTLSIASHTVTIDGRPIDLALREFQLLRHLMQANGMICTREDIFQRVWGYPQDSDSRTIETHIKRLRQKLGDAAHLVQTVRSVGYRVRVIPRS